MQGILSNKDSITRLRHRSLRKEEVLGELLSKSAINYAKALIEQLEGED